MSVRSFFGVLFKRATVLCGMTQARTRFCVSGTAALRGLLSFRSDMFVAETVLFVFLFYHAVLSKPGAIAGSVENFRRMGSSDGEQARSVTLFRWQALLFWGEVL